MLDIEQRTYTELITLYKLEPDLRDIYVEGITDKLVLDRFLKKNGVNDYKVIEVGTINFSELYKDLPHIKRNNKAKLIALSNKLQGEFSGDLEKICCIVDKDYDEYLNRMVTNEYLVYTDYTSFEMYMFNPETIRIFYKSFIRNFPHSGETTIKALERVLTEYFFIRLAIKINEDITDEDALVDLKKSAKPDKYSGDIIFNSEDHLKKILNKHGIVNKIEIYCECIKDQKCKHSAEPRNSIRGHDYIYLFNLYINKIKNPNNINEEILRRSLYQCIDYSELRKYGLFKFLLAKFA